MRDGLDDAFEIGENDDVYRSGVREDIRGIEEAEEDNASASSSKKEEVVNAYKDYLRSIRDGGFESYLDDDNGEGAPWKEQETWEGEQIKKASMAAGARDRPAAGPGWPTRTPPGRTQARLMFVSRPRHAGHGPFD